MQNHDPEEALIQLGMMVTGAVQKLLQGLWLLCRGIFRMLRYMFYQIKRIFRLIGKLFQQITNERKKARMAVIHDVHQARRDGKALNSMQVIARYLFHEHSLFKIGFNYIIATVSVVFLIAVIHYGAGMQYALSVSVGGQELGIIENESEFQSAEKEVMQRISMTGQDVDVNFKPVYALKMISENEEYITAHSIADKLLISSHNELMSAYGIYIDGEFVGAVQNKEDIQNRLSALLEEYQTTLDKNITDVYYAKKMEYRSGVYLKETIETPENFVSIMQSSDKTDVQYVVQENDSLSRIAKKYHISVEDLQEQNPDVPEIPEIGTVLNIRAKERYMPIAYATTMEVTSEIDYSTIKVQTSSLPIGTEKVISHGVRGERTTQMKITYIDGTEQSREPLSTIVTREPIPEQIGVGTYSAQPASNTTTVNGNGMFGWPVNGGRISDHFGGERNHKGLDIAAPTGTEIYASAAGKVIRAGWNSGGYGNYVIIEHPDGYRTLYAHGSEVIAVEGQEVEKGQLIMLIGSTGDSTGPHCHFEVRVNNICVNPEDYLRVNVD
ncbi:MAG: M23 family metallopeptidase [Oscillospiraceae bacterium]